MKANLDMPPKEIRIALLRAGITQAAIARSVGCSRELIHRVIEGKVVSHRARQGISEAIGIPLDRLWPSTYVFGVPGKKGRKLSRLPAKAA